MRRARQSRLNTEIAPPVRTSWGGATRLPSLTQRRAAVCPLSYAAFSFRRQQKSRARPGVGTARDGGESMPHASKRGACARGTIFVRACRGGTFVTGDVCGVSCSLPAGERTRGELWKLGTDGREGERGARVEACARGRALRAGGAGAVRLLRLARGPRRNLVEHLEDRLGLCRHHHARRDALRRPRRGVAALLRDAAPPRLPRSLQGVPHR